MEYSKFDPLLFLVKESGLTKAKYMPKVKALFPLFDPKDKYYDKHCPKSKIAMY